MNVKYRKVHLLLYIPKELKIIRPSKLRHKFYRKLKNHEIKAISLSCALVFCHVNLVSLLPEMTNYAPKAQLIA